MPLSEQVKQAILAPNSLLPQDVDKIMATLLSAPVDAADIYFQSSHFESWSLEGGIVKEGSHSIEHGAGVRVVSGDKTGFAYSDRIELPILLEAANNVKAIVRQGQHANRVQILFFSEPTFPGQPPCIDCIRPATRATTNG